MNKYYLDEIYFSNYIARQLPFKVIKNRSGCPGLFDVDELLIHKLFAKGNIFSQRIEHAFQRLLFKSAQLADGLTLFYAIFPQQQRL